jgi:predicted  nucleic acid-binding Zn-ribbon protein
MRRGDAPDDEQGDLRERRRQPRRQWFLIAACLTLVVLSAVLWAKWSDNRREAARLQRELTRVYKEAEDLRMQAALGQERIARLERELRALKAESQARPAVEDKKGGRSAPKR